MDSSAYLRRYGWEGTGTFLQPSGRGIKKPLPVSRKTNNFGIGKKLVDVHADQWWARAFDAELKGLQLDHSHSKSVASTTMPWASSDTPIEKPNVGKWSGLFDGFVKGDGLQGTGSSPLQSIQIASATAEEVVAKQHKTRSMSKITTSGSTTDDSRISELTESKRSEPEFSRRESKDQLPSTFSPRDQRVQEATGAAEGKIDVEPGQNILTSKADSDGVPVGAEHRGNFRKNRRKPRCLFADGSEMQASKSVSRIGLRTLGLSTKRKKR